ncbi:MAG: Lrp/AsnC family transcriptional regulator [Chloroflexota bacterium]
MKDWSAELDDTDRQILMELQDDSSISNVELARRISLSPPAVHARIKSLEERGYVRQYAAILDREKVGYDMLCLINVTLQMHHMDNINLFRDAVNQMPEVLECYFITGEFDYLLKVAVRSRKELERFLMEKLTPISGIARIATSIVLTEIKFTTSLSLTDEETEAEE